MKKRGFTLVELMAVVAIIAILAVVLVPTVTGYINRAKKIEVISQTRIAVNAVKMSNAMGSGVYYINEDASCKILKVLRDSVKDDELASPDELDKLGEMTVKEAMMISKDENAIKKIEIYSDGVFKSYKAD